MKSLIFNINGCKYDEMTIPLVCGGCGAIHSAEDVANGADIHELRMRPVVSGSGRMTARMSTSSRLCLLAVELMWSPSRVLVVLGP